MIARLRGPATVFAFAASYAVRRPAGSIVGAYGELPWPALLAIAPVAAAWSIARTTTGLAAATRIGILVRRAPVLYPRHALLAELDELAPMCTLVSDTHLTAEGRVPTELAVDPGQWPFAAAPETDDLRYGLYRVLAAIERDAPRTVLWCGDQVDTGDPAEWRSWRAAVDAVAGLAHRLVPGNHDICFNQPHDDDPTLARRAIRERAFQAHGPHLAAFPEVDTIASDAGPATVILLDSCKHPSRHVLSNAVGRFGDVQLDEVERILGDKRGPLLVVTHHHVWRTARFQPDEWYNTAIDSDRLARILLAYRRRCPKNHVLVCHGHRHAVTAGYITDGTVAVDVLGMPSSTLGNKAGGVLDGMLRYGVAGLRADGRWGVALVPVAALVAARRGAAGVPIVRPNPDLAALSPPITAAVARASARTPR